MRASVRCLQGAGVKALVLSCSLTARSPLHQFPSALSHYDVENLIHEGVRERDLTDDSLARALDMLVEAGPGKVLSSVLIEALRELLNCGVHNDKIRGRRTLLRVIRLGGRLWRKRTGPLSWRKLN